MAVSHATPPDASPSAGRPQRPVSSPTRASDEKKGSGGALLWLFLPALCCGGPAILAALAAASAAVLGALGGVTGAVLLVIAVGLWVRHRRRGECCAPTEKAWRP